MKLNIKASIEDVPEFLLSVPIGILGGSVCGIVILSFNSLIGRSGTTGTEYIGYWDWGILGLGIMYGSFVGLFVAPLGYLIFLRKIGLQKAILPASLGTMLGGCFGVLIGPSEALRYGCLGFFVSLLVLWLVARLIKHREA